MPVGAADGLRHVVMLHAQRAASPCIAMRTRVNEVDPAGREAALARQGVVEATPVRMTLPRVHTEDHGAFREAMESSMPAARLSEGSAASGLSLGSVDALVPRACRCYDHRWSKPPGAGVWLLLCD